MPTNLDPWLAGEAQTEGRYAFNQFECDGEHVNFGINFDGVAPGYLDRSHVMFYTTVDATGISTDPQVVPTAAWQSDTVIQLYQTGTTPYPAGVTLSIYRETPKNQPLVDFTDGSVVDEENLDTGFEQAVYGVAEMVDRFNVSNDNSSQAIAIANEANATANTALSTANTASGAATNAVSIANAATTTANGAVTTANAATETANDAKETADGIAATAAEALDQAGDAVTTANAASATANGIAATANNALTTANAASSTANDAHDLAEQALTNVSNGQFNPQTAITAPTGSVARVLFTSNASFSGAANRWAINKDNATENTQAALDYSGSNLTVTYADNAGGNAGVALILSRSSKTVAAQAGWGFQQSLAPAGGADLTNKTYVDAQVASANANANARMPIAGGSFSGDITAPNVTATGAVQAGTTIIGLGTNHNLRGRTTVGVPGSQIGEINYGSTNSSFYLRGRAGGGAEFVNSGYTAVVASFDDGGNFNAESVTGGSIVSTGGITAASKITAGSCAYQTDGNITNATVWGGALSTYLANNFAAKTAVGTQCTRSSISNFGTIEHVNATLPEPYVVMGLTGTGGATANAISIIAGALHV